MNDTFREKLNAKIAAYRTWCHNRTVSECRLVHYSGTDLVGSRSLTLGESEAEVVGLVSEGFYVDWTESDGRVYLRVWEFGGPEPEWAKVFAEVPLADTNEILRRAGFDV